MSINDGRVLFNQTQKFDIDRWSVAREGTGWGAYDPTTPDEWDADTEDDMFDTFEEAIEYAQRQARA